jgi:hypothetical protein
MGIITGIGSGGSYALAAARALLDLPDMDAETIGQCAWFLTSIPLLTHGNSFKGSVRNCHACSIPIVSHALLEISLW